MNRGNEHADGVDKAERLRSLADPLIRAVRRVSALDDFWAKVCVYYAIATHGIEELSLFPILVLRGGAGTGKSQLMEVMKHLVREPVWMSTTPTKPVLRDTLGNNTTAFVEEADSVDEEIIRNRYSRETAVARVNRQVAPGLWQEKRVDLFGATVLHRRGEFEDAAIDSRSIYVRIDYKRGDYARVEDMEDELANGVEMARKIWGNCSLTPERTGGPGQTGRAEDVWWPLAVVAQNLEDSEWLARYREEVEKAANNLRWSHGLEPDQAVLCALVALRLGTAMTPLRDVRDWLKKELGWQWSTWKVGRIVRVLGFEVRTSHGEQKVKVDKDFLVQKARELGIEDDALNGLGDITFRGLK